MTLPTSPIVKKDTAKKDFIKYTYLLGAGASAQKIPVVNGFDKQILKINSIINNTHFQNPNEFNALKRKLNWFQEEVRLHATVDTLAKKLYLTGDETNYRNLKSLIEFVFHIWHLSNIQFISNNGHVITHEYDVDPRYDAFFSQIAQRGEYGINLPSNLNILSWNYDIQLEYSLSKFLKTNSLKETIENSKIYPRMGNQSVDYNDFLIVKLNGSFLGNIINGKDEYDYSDFDFLQIKDYILNSNFFKIPSGINESPVEILYKDLVAKIANKKENGILYSWENIPAAERIREISNKAVSETHSLIIIGYSFPNFNRDIDKSLIQSMNSLEEIYVQVNSADYEGVKARILSIMPRLKDKIYQVNYQNEFYVPDLQAKQRQIIY